MADIKFASEALGRVPRYGYDALASAAGTEISIYQGKANELGFFSLENKLLLQGLLKRGVKVEVLPGGTYKTKICTQNFPTDNFDYLSRNQPLRNRILRAMSSDLETYGIRVPSGKSLVVENGGLTSFYTSTRLGMDAGIVVKKKLCFNGFLGSGYFKPLVVPLWSREIKANKRARTLFEQFIPSLLDMDISGDKQGKRCYEIRMYFCMGDKK